MNSQVFSDVMRNIVSVLQTPVVVGLLILLALALVFVGIVLVEWCVERRHLNVSMPKLMDDLRLASSSEDLRRRVTQSGLLANQKNVLCELTQHPDFTPQEREALAIRLLEQEQARYDLRVTWTNVLAKISPMFGLMGTLIPLGPGLIALGQGDTQTLSNSLLVAFDTTVIGLIAAAIAMLVSTARKRWYKNYMSMLETLEELVLEEELQRGKQAQSRQNTGAASGVTSASVAASASSQASQATRR